MSLYILDTDVLTLYEKGHSRVCQHIVAHLPAGVATTVISVEEQLSGWYNLLRKVTQPTRLEQVYQRLIETVQLFAGWQIVGFSAAAANRFQQLQAMKLNIGKMDLRIAAIVLEAGAILVTRNLRDFRRVPHLQIVDWSV